MLSQTGFAPEQLFGGRNGAGQGDTPAPRLPPGADALRDMKASARATLSDEGVVVPFDHNDR